MKGANDVCTCCLPLAARISQCWHTERLAPFAHDGDTDTVRSESEESEYLKKRHLWNQLTSSTILSASRLCVTSRDVEQEPEAEPPSRPPHPLPRVESNRIESNRIGVGVSLM